MSSALRARISGGLIPKSLQHSTEVTFWWNRRFICSPICVGWPGGIERYVRLPLNSVKWGDAWQFGDG
jgi:hypothetical protein